MSTPPDTIQQIDYDIDLLQALLWQYNSAINLQAILEAKQAWYDENQTEFWSSWYDNVFNLETADQFGLIVWGIILGLQLYVNIPPPVSQPIWGFGGTNGDVNFDNGNFASTAEPAYLLPVATQRLALQLRYFQLTSAGTVPEINRMLKALFPSGQAWLQDNLNMSQTYIFNFALTFDQRYLFNNYDILPRPAGVASDYSDNTLTYFGFNSFDNNFDNGNGFAE